MNKQLSQALGKVVKQTDNRAQRLSEADAVNRLKQYAVPVDYIDTIVRQTPVLTKRAHYLVYMPISDIELFAIVQHLSNLEARPAIYEMTQYREAEKKIIQEIARSLDAQHGWISFTVQENGKGVLELVQRIKAILETIPEIGRLRIGQPIIVSSVPTTHVSTTIASDFKGVFVILAESIVDDLAKWGQELSSTLQTKASEYLDQVENSLREDPVFYAKHQRRFRDRVVAEAAFEKNWQEDAQRQTRIDEALGVMGSGVFLLLHRFVNLLRPAGILTEFFLTMEDIEKYGPELYEDNMKQLESILGKIKRFDKTICSAKNSGIFSQNLEHHPRDVQSVIQAIEDYAEGRQLLIKDETREKDKVITVKWHPFFAEAIEVVLDNVQKALETQPEKTVYVKALNEGDKVAVQIKNLGTSISPTMLREIRSHRPVSSITGTGLGLYFTWTLLQYINGDIDVDNLPGNQGVITNLYIPTY